MTVSGTITSLVGAAQTDVWVWDRWLGKGHLIAGMVRFEQVVLAIGPVLW
jgi:hypothetical protein